MTSLEMTFSVSAYFQDLMKINLKLVWIDSDIMIWSIMVLPYCPRLGFDSDQFLILNYRSKVSFACKFRKVVAVFEYLFLHIFPIVCNYVPRFFFTCCYFISGQVSSALAFDFFPTMPALPWKKQPQIARVWRPHCKQFWARIRITSVRFYICYFLLNECLAERPPQTLIPNMVVRLRIDQRRH